MTFSREGVGRIWKAVKANNAKLDGCSRHMFSGGAPDLGKKMICQCCCGEMSLPDIALYIRGYEASGSSAVDIWPEYGLAKAKH